LINPENACLKKAFSFSDRHFTFKTLRRRLIRLSDGLERTPIHRPTAVGRIAFAAALQLQEYQASAAQTAAVRSSSHARAAPSTSGSSFSRTSAW